MKEFRWSKLKSQRLKKIRGVSFEELTKAEVVAIRNHSSRRSQRIVFFYYKSYIWMAPCVEETDYIFLKTLYPSRKFTKKYKIGEL